MELRTKYCTYKELAEALGCSYHYAARVHAKRIIEAYNIDKKRLPRAGMLPVELVERYFSVDSQIQETKKTN